MPRLYHKLGYFMPLAGGDPEMTYATPNGFFPGQVVMMQDRSYGERYFMVVQNRSGSAMAQGDLVSSIGDTTGLTAFTATGGTTTSVIGTGLTANKHPGAIIIVKDDAGAAGAAPESEDSIVESNSTTTVKVLKDLPFTAAPANGDTTEIFNTWGVEDAAAGDYSDVVKGVVISEAGIPDTYYGLVQCFGICRRVNVLASTTLAVGSMLIAAAATVTVTGAASGHRLHVGKSMGTVTSDSVLMKAVARLACAAYGKSFSDVDALA